MRRFSQRNALVTLSDINITPLLDLAFVLLIIFVITTPLLEQSLDLTLPKGGRADRRIRREDIRTVEIDPKGTYRLQGQAATLNQVELELVRSFRANTNLVIKIRGDIRTQWGSIFPLMDRLSNQGVRSFSFSAEPGDTRR